MQQGIGRVVNHDVITVTPQYDVSACAARQAVVTRQTFDLVGTCRPGEGVDATGAHNLVTLDHAQTGQHRDLVAISVESNEFVVGDARHQLGAPAFPHTGQAHRVAHIALNDQGIGVGRQGPHIVGIEHQGVVAGTADIDLLDAGDAVVVDQRQVQRLVAALHLQHVRATATLDGAIGGVIDQGVIACATQQGVVAIATAEGVVAIEATDGLVAIACRQGVAQVGAFVKDGDDHRRLHLHGGRGAVVGQGEGGEATTAAALHPVAFEGQGVRRIAQDLHRVAGIESQDVAGRRGQCGAGSTGHQVDGADALDDAVVLCRQVERRGAAAQAQGVVTISTIDHQISGVVDQHVVAVVTAQHISPGTAIQGVVAIETAHQVIAAGAGHRPIAIQVRVDDGVGGCDDSGHIDG